jgi:hypothetical protein
VIEHARYSYFTVVAGDGDKDHLGGDSGDPPTIELDNGLFEVGRAAPADIIIPVPSVSGRHAMLRVGEISGRAASNRS